MCPICDSMKEKAIRFLHFILQDEMHANIKITANIIYIKNRTQITFYKNLIFF